MHHKYLQLLRYWIIQLNLTFLWVGAKQKESMRKAKGVFKGVLVNGRNPRNEHFKN